MPALEAANDAVLSLDKSHIAVMKALPKPPPDVAFVMDAVMVLLQKDIGWNNVKLALNDTGFLKSIMEFEKDNISAKTLKRIESYTKDPRFTYEYMIQKATAAAALCKWARAIEDYAKCLKIVNPKREKKRIAEEKVAEMEAALLKYREEYAVIDAKLQKLKREVEEKQAIMQKLKDDLTNLQMKIDRGEKLVSSLADEKSNWINRLAGFEEDYNNLLGDSILAAAFMSYAGPFPSDFRNDLNAIWKKKVVE